jgi:predicted PurR-regulated permease PerM
MRRPGRTEDCVLKLRERDAMPLRQPSARKPAAGRPTPIRISRTAWRLIVVAMIAAVVLILWTVPVVLLILLGAFALALVLSFPVALLTHVLPRAAAVAIAFLILLAILILVAYVFVPLLVAQAGALASVLPALVQDLELYIVRALQAVNAGDFLSSSPEEIAARLAEDLRTSFGVITANLLGHTMGVVFGTFSVALTLFAVVFVAASLLANVRMFKAAYLTSVSGRYRHDARELWDALAHALSHYLGGLAFVLAIQGVLSAAALWLIGVPYPLALGAWVSITAVIPFLGAWLGAIPALLVAFSISPTAVVLTAIVFLAIQQFESAFLTPHIQAQTIKVPAVVVFLGVIVGGAVAGLMGVLFAVPTIAALRVLFDFFRVRLRTD